MIRNPMNRRTVLASTATALGLATVAQAQTTNEASGNGVAKYVPELSDFPYEVTRTEAEWREMLGDEMTYGVLRQSDTEWPFTTDLWKEPHEAGYLCRGCDLPLYDASWFQRLEKGWVFFHHARVNAVMFGQDGPVRQYGQSDMGSDEDDIAMTEVHCRRCGSHTGHHLLVQGMYLHCINGTSLKLA